MSAPTDHHATHRFRRPGLRAEVVSRIVLGNKVVDHEREFGVRGQPCEVVAVYEVTDGLIRSAGLFPADRPEASGGSREGKGRDAMRSIARRALVILGLFALMHPGATLADAGAGARAELLALHEKTMRAHRQGDVELLLEDESEDYVVAGRGEITRPTLAQRRERFTAFLGATTFTEYRDLVAPIVTTSEDGTLGWVIVQVRARGTQVVKSGAKQPLQFVSAWIELYQKRDGRWFRVGNVSNFRPS